jgi:hypothetical protein
LKTCGGVRTKNASITASLEIAARDDIGPSVRSCVFQALGRRMSFVEGLPGG